MTGSFNDDDNVGFEAGTTPLEGLGLQGLEISTSHTAC
jgi:hypothetical protein